MRPNFAAASNGLEALLYDIELECAWIIGESVIMAELDTCGGLFCSLLWRLFFGAVKTSWSSESLRLVFSASASRIDLGV
jgi:hypothetical protein